MTIFSPHGGIASRNVEKQAEMAVEPTDYTQVLDRYAVPPGKILVARDRTPQSWDNDGLIAMTDERKELVQQFEPWATVLMIGDPYMTDYGTTITPPNVKQGQRVLISPTAGRDVELRFGDAAMMVTLVGFAGIMLIDRGASE